MKWFYLLALLSLIVLLAACGSQPAVTQPANPQAVVPAITNKPAWQEDWEKTLKAAQGEGKVVALTTLGSQTNFAINKVLKEKYGFELELMVGPAPALFAKLQKERSAGLYIPDVYISGTGSLYPLKAPGFLDPIKPLLILPESIDQNSWLESNIKFLEKEGIILGYQVRVGGALTVNSDIVKPDDIRSYKDLLNPKWKGKISTYDPSLGSTGVFFFMTLWEIMGPDYTKELAKQDIVITRDGRLQVEWVARGKYPITGSPFATILTEFVKAGAPLKAIAPVEGTLSTTSQGNIALLNKAPHPNAAKIFINWLLTKEGQTIMSKITGDASRRLDVSKEWIDPDLLMQPGVKYVDTNTEEMIKKRMELQEVSREVWNIK